MPFKTITTWTRPSLDVNFFQAPDGLKELNAPFIASGNLTMEFDYSIDGKTLTQTSIFTSKAIHDTFVADTARAVFLQQRKEYNDAHGIVFVNTTSTEI